MERLQKVLAAAGVASRRNSEKLITEGRVKVNGTVVTELGTKVEPNDEIRVDGRLIQSEQKVYYLFNKPKRTISASSDHRGRDTVVDYFSDVKERVFAVGRLDYDTTGILLMTNDGEFANLMSHPKFHLPKTYEVAVDGVLTDQMLRMLERGIELSDGMTLPAEVELISRKEGQKKTVIHLTIYEGRNRQVKRMMKYFHCEVTRLARIRYGFLELGNLHQGEYRKLRMYEVKKLIRMASHSTMPEASSEEGSGSM